MLGDNATFIGVAWPVCERDIYARRAFPALDRVLDLDEHRSAASPYLVKRP